MRPRALPIPLLLVALVVIGGGCAWIVLDWLARPHRTIEAAPVGDGRVEPGRTAVDAESRLRVTREAAGAPRPAAEPASRLPLPIYPAARARGELAVQVFDEEGRSTSDVVVALRSTAGGFQPGLEVGDDRAIALERTTGRDGRVDFADVPVGPYRLLGRAPDGRQGRVDVAFRAAAGALPITLPLFGPEGGVELAVLVDDDHGRPVAGAQVSASGDQAGHGAVGGEREPALTGVTDADGRLLFPGVEMQQVVLLARAPDGRIGCSLAPHRGDTTEFDEQGRWWERVVVAPAARLTVRAAGVDPAQLVGATLFADLRTSELPHDWSWGAAIPALPPTSDGRFRFEALPEGRVTFRLDSPRGVRLVAAPIDFGGPLENSARPPVADVAAGESREIELAVALGGTIRGRVRTSDGAPVAGARVTAVLAPPTSNFPEGFVLRGANVWRFDEDNARESLHPFSHPRARTDANGDYVLTGLQPGRQRVEVRAARLSFDRREGVAVADGATVALDHVLEPAGVLQGVSNAEGYLGVTRAGAPVPFAIAILSPSRTFTFAGLAAGDYVLAQFHSNGDIEPVELARATVVAGRTTWIDLSEVPGPHAIRGRLLDAHGPIAGARVGFSDLAATTDALGRFVVPRAFAWSGRIPLHVTFEGVHYLRPIDAGDGLAELGDVELRLGDEPLVLTTANAEGVALEGTLSLSSAEALGDDAAARVLSASIPIGASGRLMISRLDPGAYRVEARYANGAVRHEKIDVPRAEPLDVAPPPVGEVELVVRDGAGRPVRSCIVTLASWLGEGEIPSDAEVEGHDELFDWATGYTDRAGRFAARGVRAGRVVARAWGTEAAPLPAPVSLRFVLVADEQREVTLVVDRR